MSYIGFELLFGSGPFPSEGIMLQFKRKSEKKSEKEGQRNIANSFCTVKQYCCLKEHFTNSVFILNVFNFTIFLRPHLLFFVGVPLHLIDFSFLLFDGVRLPKVQYLKR